MKKLLIIILFLCSFIFSGCAKSKGFTKTIYVFDTNVNINLYEGNEANLGEIVDMLYRLHKLTDQYNSYAGINNIHSINEQIKAGSKEIEIEAELANLLMFAKYHDMVNSYYNVKFSDYVMFGIGEITNTWKEAINTKTLPSEATINNYLDNLSNGKYDFDCIDNKVIVGEDSKVSFDLGSIVKGYAASLVYKYLGENNISKYLIDFGQSTILLGQKSNNKGFNVLVNGTSYVLKDVKNSYIGTASILERSVSIDGKVYHHIIDPQTCYPTSTYDTVVVKSDLGNVDLTDLMATYLMINPDGASDLIKAYQMNLHIYFFKDGQLVKEVGEA